MALGSPQTFLAVPPCWRVTIEATAPDADPHLDRQGVALLIDALRRHDAAGLIAGRSSFGAKLRAHAPDIESALGAGLQTWGSAARAAGLVQWALIRCEAVRERRNSNDAGPHPEERAGCTACPPPARWQSLP